MKIKFSKLAQKHCHRNLKLSVSVSEGLDPAATAALLRCGRFIPVSTAGPACCLRLLVDELLCAAMEQLKLYEQPIAAGAPSSPGNASIWAPELASASRVDRQCAYNGITCACLGPGKISVLFWLDNLLSASTILKTASNNG